MHAAASQMSVAKDRLNSQVPDTQKSTETLLELPENKLPGPGQSTTCTLEEGSLLSMVSSYTVDVTVAASEKVYFEILILNTSCSFLLCSCSCSYNHGQKF